MCAMAGSRQQTWRKQSVQRHEGVRHELDPEHAGLAGLTHSVAADISSRDMRHEGVSCSFASAHEAGRTRG